MDKYVYKDYKCVKVIEKWADRKKKPISPADLRI